MKFVDIKFLLSVHSMAQLPEAGIPEIVFAGRSNVGKSSLINTLVGRKGLVKVSGRPGKTQGLNFFQLGDSAYLVDLPGYGFAKVSRGMQDKWQTLITEYLETRSSICCVVVIMDIRHGAKPQDTQLISWLKQHDINYLPVYTKVDKLSGNQRQKNSRALDAGHTINSSQRILFSAKTSMGKEDLERALATFAKIG